MKEIPLSLQSQLSCRRFSLADIKSATRNFEYLIGQGGFGDVYRGVIDNGATTVAIKRLHSRSSQGASEFWTEIEVLSKIRHSHIVSFIGYCFTRKEMILVYEYLPCGNLAEHLYESRDQYSKRSTLTWVQRLRICIEVARALDYLHTGTSINHTIIHRDVKSSNILLDENWAAKITDLGISKLGPADQSRFTTAVKGTYGYLDPEYFRTQQLTTKTDVYSFGVVLCEILCGRRPMDMNLHTEHRSLAVWASHCIKKGTLDQIIDPVLMGQMLPDSLKVFEQIADQCLHSSSEERPAMDHVVVSLTYALALQERTNSFMFVRNIFNADGAYDNEERADSSLEQNGVINSVSSGHHDGETLNILLSLQSEQQGVINSGSSGHHDGETLNIPLSLQSEQQEVINSGSSGHHDGETLNIPLSLQSQQLCHRFSLAEIQSATYNFHDELVIGRGGFGNVYKGVIDNGATIVAIKRLNPMSKQGAPQFWTEIAMLSRIRHSHIISLIGYCNDQKEMIIVYEYMVHGTLADNLHKISRNGGNNSTLSWEQRLKICIGAARGLDYLHTGMSVEQRVIHRDVKSSNILLDGNWAAKISDFGLSETGPANQPCTQVSTKFKGTSGYIDDEYFLTRHLTRKSDVYAFGVVLFEVVCGRQALDLKLNMEQRLLAGWAQQCIKEGTLEQIIDPILTGQIFPDSLKVFKQIAGQCLHNLSKERPTMAEVVVSLERALALQERTEFSIFEAEFFNTGGAFDNQETADSNMEQQQILRADSSMEQNEVINACNGDEHIDRVMRMDNANITQSRVKPARRPRTMTFTRKVGRFFFGTSQMTSDMNQRQDFQSHTNILGHSQENSNNRKRKGKDATTKRLSKKNDGEQLQVTDDHNGQPMEGVGKGVAPATYFHLTMRGLKEHICELESRLRAEEEKNKEKDRDIEALMAQLMKFQSGLITSPLAEKVASNTHKNVKREYTKLSSNVCESCDSPSKVKNEKFKNNGTRQSQILSSDPKCNIWKKEKNPDYGGKKGAIMAFASMLDTIMTTDAVKIPVNIFGDNLHATYIPKNELVRFCKMEALDIVCVIAYIRCLYENFVSSFKVIKYVNPLSAHEAFLRKNLHELIMDRLQSATKNQIFFIPFNPGYHWVLVVIDCTTMTVFWVDSLHGAPSSDFKLYINTGLEALVVKGKNWPPPTWKLIKGPFQPGNVECGFYVLKFMKELVKDPSKSIKIKMEELVGKATYESHEIDEVQHEFIEFIKEYIMWDTAGSGYNGLVPLSGATISLMGPVPIVSELPIGETETSILAVDKGNFSSVSLVWNPGSIGLVSGSGALASMSGGSEGGIVSTVLVSPVSARSDDGGVLKGSENVPLSEVGGVIVPFVAPSGFDGPSTVMDESIRQSLAECRFVDKLVILFPFLSHIELSASHLLDICLILHCYPGTFDSFGPRRVSVRTFFLQQLAEGVREFYSCWFPLSEEVCQQTRDFLVDMRIMGFKLDWLEQALDRALKLQNASVFQEWFDSKRGILHLIDQEGVIREKLNRLQDEVFATKKELAEVENERKAVEIVEQASQRELEALLGDDVLDLVFKSFGETLFVPLALFS